ncbi:major facilitator superfamily domain-containing protein [Daedaleopsis nitida]|nr:major facilitator superfamily domain-containing protein [Daedaleopsis nitida]
MSQIELETTEKPAGSSSVSVAKSNASDSESTTAQSADDVPAPDANAFPEGGLAGWCAVAGSFFIQFCTFGYLSSFGAYQDNDTRVYLSHENSSSISWIGSIAAFLIISSGLFVGRLHDRGYFYHLLYGGSLLLSVSLFMHSLAKPDAYCQIFLSQGIGAGIGAGLTYIPSMAVISQHFHKRRALAMSIASSGSSLGSIVHPLMLNNMLNNPSMGFAIAVRADAHEDGAADERGRPAERGAQVCEGQGATRMGSVTDPYRIGRRLSVFIMGFYFPLFYLQLDALTHGLEKSFSFYALVFTNASSFVGRLSPALYVHFVGVENLLVISTLGCAVVILSMIALKTLASVIAIGVIYGLLSGVYITLLAPWLAMLADDITEIGARMGVAFFFCGVGSLIGTPIEGSLLTNNYVWWKPALFAGIMALAGWACFTTSVTLHRRKRQHGSIAKSSDAQKA